MKQLTTAAIILSRTDYGEADRIITVITPQYGKLALIAKGVRRVKSKLAGGIELFSVSEITFIKGRGDVSTLVSTRLGKHYGAIVNDLERTMLGYELIKQLNKITEDETEESYFELLRQSFEALNDAAISVQLIRYWFTAQLLALNGHAPNLQTDQQGRRLEPNSVYDFDFEIMGFRLALDRGTFAATHIKFLRLVFAGNSPKVLSQVQGSRQLCLDTDPLMRHLTQLALE